MIHFIIVSFHIFNKNMIHIMLTYFLLYFVVC